MENATAIVILAVGVIICSILVIAAFNITNSANLLAYDAVSEINGQTKMSATLEKELVGKDLSGSDVRYYAKSLREQGLGVRIKTKLNSGNGTYSTDDLNVTTSKDYVKPTAVYRATIETSTNDELEGVSFVEDGASQGSFSYASAMSAQSGDLTAIGEAQRAIYDSISESKENASAYLEAQQKIKDLLDERSASAMNKADSEDEQEEMTDTNKVSHYTNLANVYKRYSKFYANALELVNKFNALDAQGKGYDMIIYMLQSKYYDQFDAVTFPPDEADGDGATLGDDTDGADDLPDLFDDKEEDGSEGGSDGEDIEGGSFIDDGETDTQSSDTTEIQGP